MPVWAIVLAAGSATRFGAPKQFELVNGVRLVDRVVSTARLACDAVVVVLPEETAWTGPPVAAAVAGAPTRAGSVRRGLAAVPSEAEIIVVHDAAHPLASVQLFEAVIARVRSGDDAAVPGLPIAETLGRVRCGRLVSTEPSTTFMSLQTPHAFRASVLRVLHREPVEATDDASLFLARGGVVRVVPGEVGNIHVTTPEDLMIADGLARCGGSDC